MRSNGLRAVVNWPLLALSEDDGGEVAGGAGWMLVVLGRAHYQGALDQQVQLLGRALRVGMAKRHQLPREEFAEAPPERLGLRMCRMAGIREGKVGREVPAASEVLVRDELVEPIEQTEKPGSGLRGAGQRGLVPRKVLLGGTAEHRLHESVLAPEVLVQRPAGDVRLLEQRVDTDGGTA